MAEGMIKELKEDGNHAFGRLYTKYSGMVTRYVINNSGSAEDAKDVFQDTMLVLVEKLQRDDFQLTASLKTYIMAIARNLWLKRLRTAGRKVALDEELQDTQFMNEIDTAIEEERTYADRLQQMLHKITAHCRGLIHDMFFRKKNIEQIQKKYGYASRHNAQNQKYKCLEQIRKVKKISPGK